MVGRRAELGETRTDVANRRAELPAHVAEAFARLPLRPAIRLSKAQPEDPVIGQLGGRGPVGGMLWPVLGDGTPLGFVARLDLAALARPR